MSKFLELGRLPRRRPLSAFVRTFLDTRRFEGGSDSDWDFNLNPSGIIYPARFVMLDATTQDGCFMGGLNAMCIGAVPQTSEFAPGQIGNAQFPYIAAQASEPSLPPGSQSRVGVYGPGRNCLVDVDPAFAGQIRPGSLIICSNSGFATLASPFGQWNQWICGIARSFANGGYTVNVKLVIFPWSPTGS